MYERPKRKTRSGEGVGYGNPPVHTRFKKGQSGNPRGRPKGTVSLAATLERTLKEKVTVTENGRRRVISKLDAAVKQLTNKAAAGNPSSIKLLLDLTQVVESQFNANINASVTDLPAADRQVIARMLDRLQHSTKGDDDETSDT